jgi:thioredoxin 1
MRCLILFAVVLLSLPLAFRVDTPEVQQCVYGKVMLYFHAGWCAPCKTMDPIVNRIKNEGKNVYIVDVDKNVGLATRYGVTSVPTFVFLDGYDREINRLRGINSKETLESNLTANRWGMPNRNRPKPKGNGGCPSGGCGHGGCPNGQSPNGRNDRPQGNSNRLPEVKGSDYPAIVIIHNMQGGSPTSLVSGSIVDRDENEGTEIVLSCAHGYEMGCTEEVVTQDGRHFQSEILCVDKQRDLMVLKIEDTGIDPMTIEMDAPKKGDKVTMIGFAEGRVLVGSVGTLTDTEGMDDFLSTTCDVWHGCSGGPILNSQGKIIATVTGGMGEQGQGMIASGPLKDCIGPNLSKTLNRIKVRSM